MRKFARLIFGLAGVGLLIAACFAVAGDASDRAKAIELARVAPVNLVLGLILLPMANLAISAAVFHVLYRRFGKVGFAELLILMGSAWLLNYLPLRPGMVGRIAYHKRVNGIDVRQSVRTLVESMACSVGAAGIGLTLCRIASAAAWSDARFVIVMCGTALALVAVSWALRPGTWHVGALGCALGLRVADLSVWMFRYFAAFAIMGHPISASSACVVACASQAAMAFALWGNGIGVREWSVGLTGAGISKELSAGAGLAADLVNRAAELVTALPLGVVCTVVAARSAARGAMPGVMQGGSSRQAGEQAAKDQ